jgi:hypothetical protein
MDDLRDQRWYDCATASVYCGLSPTYFKNQHKEGRGPAYIKPSPRRVFFTRDALDRWMAGWKVVSK